MKAIIYTEYGAPDVLRLADVSKPVPKSNELLIRVHASSVSSGAIWVRQGRFPTSKILTSLLRLMFGITKPKRPIIGFEFSGIVEDIGENVRRFTKGDEVYGTTTGLKQGSYAEYVCVPETWRQGVVAIKPPTLTFEEAAVLPVGSMTALHLLTKARLQAGQNVLIYGASGSVGTFGVQIAKYFGARVTGVCSTGNVGLVRSLGADAVLAYTKEDMTQSKEQFDIVFDAVGKLKTSELKSLLRKGGTFCSVKSPTDEKLEYLDALHTMIAAGRLKPVIDRSYPFEQMVEAHRYVDAGHKKGNVIIRH